tara:strand:- start:408 stop:518 length:111 start_codon:yes stop_codon:yes gene_type:complete
MVILQMGWLLVVMWLPLSTVVVLVEAANRQVQGLVV